MATRAVLPDPPLERAVADALTAAPEVRAAGADVEAARSRVAPAASLPDPTASLVWDGDRRMVSAMFSQALPWPGKRGLAAKLASADADVTAASTGRAALTIESRVRNAWYDLELAVALDHLAADRKATAKQIEEIARTRYAAGLAVQQDVVRAQIEIARIDEQTFAQSAAIASGTAVLSGLVGHPVEVDSVPFSDEIPTTDDLIAAAAARSPELAAAGAAVAAARIRLEAAQKNLLPDFVVSAGPMAGSMSKSFSVGAGISLPLYAARKQRGQIAEAESLLRAREADREAIARDLELRTRERAASLGAATKTAALYRDQLIPLDEVALESAIAGYQSGKIPFIALLEAVHALHDDHFAYLARVAEAAKWRAALDEASLSSTAVAATAATSGSGIRPATGMPSM